MKKFLGVTTLIMVNISVIIGFIGILYFSLILSLIYAGIIVISSFSIVYAYCAKCSCRFKDCAHVLPAKLACILPERKDLDYTKTDNLILITSLILLLGFPQYFLWHNTRFFILFWGLVVLSSVPIYLYLCKRCCNKKCALNRNN
jgi:hypothetical protein